MKGGATIAQIPNKKDSTKNTNATTPSSDQHEYDLYSILTSGDRHQQGAKDSVPYPMPQSHTSTPSTVLQQNPIPYYENRQMYPQQNDYPNYYQQRFQHENLLNGNQYYGYNPQQTPNGHYQTQVPFRAHADGQLMNLSLPAVAPLNYRKTTLKLVILGNSGVGKTSLMNRYHSNKYTGQYKATIGADFLSKTIQMDDCSVTLTIWDTAGQERFQSLGKAFYRGSDACVLVYDVQDFQSLEGLRKWKEDFEDCLISSEGTSMGKSGRSFNQQISPKVQFVVVGNKADKEEECKVVTIEDGKRFADEIGGMFFECSAKTGMNVNELFMVAARAGLEYNRNKNMGIGISRHTYGQQNTDGRPPASMRGYIPPRRTVDLNRTSSSRMGNDDCC